MSKYDSPTRGWQSIPGVSFPSESNDGRGEDITVRAIQVLEEKAVRQANDKVKDMDIQDIRNILNDKNVTIPPTHAGELEKLKELCIEHISKELKETLKLTELENKKLIKANGMSAEDLKKIFNKDGVDLPEDFNPNQSIRDQKKALVLSYVLNDAIPFSGGGRRRTRRSGKRKAKKSRRKGNKKRRSIKRKRRGKRSKGRKKH